MSELTLCNYHSLKRMEQRARQRGVTVIVERVRKGEWLGWISARYSDQDEPSAWFMELTDHCVC